MSGAPLIFEKNVKIDLRMKEDIRALRIKIKLVYESSSYLKTETSNDVTASVVRIESQ